MLKTIVHVRRIKEFGSKLMHHGQPAEGQTTTTTTHHQTTGMPGQTTAAGMAPGQTTASHYSGSTTGGQVRLPLTAGAERLLSCNTWAQEYLDVFDPCRHQLITVTCFIDSSHVSQTFKAKTAYIMHSCNLLTSFVGVQAAGGHGCTRRRDHYGCQADRHYGHGWASGCCRGVI